MPRCCLYNNGSKLCTSQANCPYIPGTFVISSWLVNDCSDCCICYTNYPYMYSPMMISPTLCRCTGENIPMLLEKNLNIIMRIEECGLDANTAYRIVRYIVLHTLQQCCWSIFCRCTYDMLNTIVKSFIVNYPEEINLLKNCGLDDDEIYSIIYIVVYSTWSYCCYRPR